MVFVPEIRFAVQPDRHTPTHKRVLCLAVALFIGVCWSAIRQRGDPR
jgi:hypothetical protein